MSKQLIEVSLIKLELLSKMLLYRVTPNKNTHKLKLSKHYSTMQVRFHDPKTCQSYYVGHVTQ